MGENQRVGEVVEASTTDFVAQCYELYELPPLGSLVKTREQDVAQFGIVSGRPPLALSRDGVPSPGVRTN